ncbi:uncharacterized protein EAE98_000164 [Botrytis deweyae]|uniref:Uncharacterized protein n=1 Tax=Botrytis deweyae TaxID=2478750 RepID=A0ABQ7J1W4_9HELO|nr:uncharacterized protein EAE98_000164 [Botrytis deweyae]KAF7940037.1 hypothetical protein EAE98_000164 [Botrytis deweyae]
MYIPRLSSTLNAPTLTTRAESPPTSGSSEGFWQVQFNFWGTILAFIAAIAIITGILTWCLVCRGKRIQKKLAKAKEKEREEEERAKNEMMGKVLGGDANGVARNGSKLGVGRNGTVRKSEISRPFPARSGSSGSVDSMDEKRELEMEYERQSERDNHWSERAAWKEEMLGTESPVPSYHSRERSGDEERSEWRTESLRGGNTIGSGNTTSTNVNGNANAGNAWHRIEVNGTVYMGRERGDSAYLEDKEIKFV